METIRVLIVKFGARNLKAGALSLDLRAYRERLAVAMGEIAASKPIDKLAGIDSATGNGKG